MIIQCASELRKVGQGCFYTALIEADSGEPFSFVYDCGSDTQGDALKTEIGVFQHLLGSRGLDMLVLSHLDADHVNGLDMLLKRVGKTETVFLPYFTPIERLLCALRFPNEAEPTYYELLADPVTFLLARGVKTIVFLGPSNADEERLPDTPPEGPSRYDEKRIPKLDLDNLEDDAGTLSLLSHESNTHATNPAILCKTDRQTTNLSWMWRFRFFHKEEGLRDEITRLMAKTAPRAQNETRPISIRAAAFLDAVEAIRASRRPRTRTPLSPQALLDAIRDEFTRSAIKKAYGRITALHNDVSLVLWHGPLRLPGWSFHSEMFGFREAAYGDRYLPLPFWQGCVRKTTGTMLTGDLNLKIRKTKEGFLRHYSQHLPETAFFYLPHHGSRHNWRTDIDMLVSMPACFVSAGLRSKHGHPHFVVLDDLELNHGVPVYWSHERQAVFLCTRGFNLT